MEYFDRLRWQPCEAPALPLVLINSGQDGAFFLVPSGRCYRYDAELECWWVGFSAVTP